MRLPALLLVLCSSAIAEPLQCDFADYRWADDLQATAVDGDVLLSWRGGPVMWVRGTFGMTPVGATRLRARFGIERGRPVIRELATVATSGDWEPLVSDARPGFRVMELKRTGSRLVPRPVGGRSRDTDSRALREEESQVLQNSTTSSPAEEGVGTDALEDAERVKRSEATFDLKTCRVHSEVDRLELSLDGLTLGSFEGILRFSVTRGTDELRQEAVLYSPEPLVGYSYRAGLIGLRSDDYSSLHWMNDSGEWQTHRFGGDASGVPAFTNARKRITLLTRPQPAFLAVNVPPRADHSAFGIGLRTSGVWFAPRSDGLFDIGIRESRFFEELDSARENADAVRQSGDRVSEAAGANEEALMEGLVVHRIGVRYDLDRGKGWRLNRAKALESIR